ncbi:MAG: HlyD family efflux transporter periplasmic adaptor subunit [Eubacteriales bacterium]
MARVKVTPQFYLVLFLFIASIISIVYVLVQPEQTAEIEYGTIEFKESFDGVVLRDEDIVNIEEFSKAEYEVAEGAEVVRGELVASAYTLTYSEKTVDALYEIRQEIKEYQEGTLLKDIVNVELTSLNASIEEKSLQIRNCVTGRSDDDLLNLEREMALLMQKKEDYLTSAVKADDYLNELYDEKEALEREIEESKMSLYAESSGVISFYFDGLEGFLNMDNIDSYDVNEIQNIILGTDLAQYQTNDVQYSLYKVVNSARWYVVIASDRDIEEFDKHTYFTMIFDENTEKQYTGELLGKRIYSNGYVFTFEFTEDIDQMLDSRVVSIEMYNVFEGLMVPTAAIQNEEGVKYLNVERDGETVAIPIVIATSEKGKAIVKEVDGYDALVLGDTIIY